MLEQISKRFDGSFISRHFFPGPYKYNNLKNINMGRCYDWAYFAYRLYPNITLWSNDYHAWVETNGCHWDSETSADGQNDYMDLRCNRVYKNALYWPWEDMPPTVLTLNNFKQFWNKNGAGYQCHWLSRLESDLRKVMRKLYSSKSYIIKEDIKFDLGSLEID